MWINGDQTRNPAPLSFMPQPTHICHATLRLLEYELEAIEWGIFDFHTTRRNCFAIKVCHKTSIVSMGKKKLNLAQPDDEKALLLLAFGQIFLGLT